MKANETRQFLVELVIPVVVLIVTLAVKFISDTRGFETFLAVAVVVVILVLVWVGSRFLEDREARWRANNEEHSRLTQDLAAIKQRLTSIEYQLDTNGKINNLWKEISYLKGATERRRR
jgi:membrane protein implicated in regulation of membrane protease activity